MNYIPKNQEEWIGEKLKSFSEIGFLERILDLTAAKNHTAK